MGLVTTNEQSADSQSLVATHDSSRYVMSAILIAVTYHVFSSCTQSDFLIPNKLHHLKSASLLLLSKVRLIVASIFMNAYNYV